MSELRIRIPKQAAKGLGVATLAGLAGAAAIGGGVVPGREVVSDVFSKYVLLQQAPEKKALVLGDERPEGFPVLEYSYQTGQGAGFLDGNRITTGQLAELVEFKTQAELQGMESVHINNLEKEVGDSLQEIIDAYNAAALQTGDPQYFLFRNGEVPDASGKTGIYVSHLTTHALEYLYSSIGDVQAKVAEPFGSAQNDEPEARKIARFNINLAVRLISSAEFKERAQLLAFVHANKGAIRSSLNVQPSTARPTKKKYSIDEDSDLVAQNSGGALDLVGT